MKPLDTWHTCYRCSLETQQPLELCPQCGHRMHTAQQVRRLGWILAGTGALLVLFIGVIAYFIIRIIMEQTADRFTGGTGDAVFLFGVLYLVAMFGGVGVVAGIWQIRYGRRNRKLVVLMMGLGLMFFILGLFIQTFG